MPRTEVYQLRLTKAEKDLLAAKARERGLSIAGLIRTEVGLHPTPVPRHVPERRNSTTGSTPYVSPASVEPTAIEDARRLEKLIKQLEAQGLPNAEEVARKRLGL